MNKNGIFILSSVVVLLAIGYLISALTNVQTDDGFVTYTVDTKHQDLRMYWKNDKGQYFRSIENLNNWLELKNKTLIFAMNAGMYKKDHSPHGLYVENGKQINPLDTANGDGNFYLMPNGVFYISKDQLPFICKTNQYLDTGQVQYATQSGPMLLIDGQMHPAFKEGSKNLNIRNGVGILPNNQVVFAMSKAEINFYDFAKYFQSLGCKNALYLDGFVSRTYLPEINWKQLDGNFGVMIGVTAEKKK
jgi:uncharacterized protein YigE (DUF2233 family)